MIGLVGPRVVCVSVGALLLGPVVVYCPGQLANADGLSLLMKVPSEQARHVAPIAPGKKLDRRPFLWRFFKNGKTSCNLFWPAPHGNFPTKTPIVTGLRLSK